MKQNIKVIQSHQFLITSSFLWREWAKAWMPEPPCLSHKRTHAVNAATTAQDKPPTLLHTAVYRAVAINSTLLWHTCVHQVCPSRLMTESVILYSRSTTRNSSNIGLSHYPSVSPLKRITHYGMCSLPKTWRRGIHKQPGKRQVENIFKLQQEQAVESIISYRQ